MMEGLFIGVMLFFLAGLGFCKWGMICNYRTCRDRTRLVGMFRGREDWRLLIKDYEATSYDRHMWDLILLRNPWKRYSTRLQSLLSCAPLAQQSHLRLSN